MSAAHAIAAAPAAAFLPVDSPLRRLPRAPNRSRPRAFFDGFEDRALVYDAFRHADGERILLVGPPPLNLWPHYRRARYRSGGTMLHARYFPSASTMITELSGAPSGAASVTMELAGQSFDLAIGANHAGDLAGRRLLFTMSKNNDLAWITEWARWHHAMHGADAVLVFDNGSTAYATAEIEATLLAIDGIERVAVISWPWRYGVTDPAIANNPYYILFLQVASMSVALRRFAAAAQGLLNADVDELVATPAGTTIFDLTRRSPRGLVAMSGRFVEPVTDEGAPARPTHRHYSHALADARRARSRPNKWCIDPSRRWFGSLRVQPYMHWIENRPPFSKSVLPGVFYRHFRAINTNWKDVRTMARHTDSTALVRDTEFAQLVATHAF